MDDQPTLHWAELKPIVETPWLQVTKQNPRVNAVSSSKENHRAGGGATNSQDQVEVRCVNLTRRYCTNIT